MAKTISIPVIVRTQDNGDGGYSTHLYNNETELLAAHHLMEDLVVGGPMWQSKSREILDEHDPYENGCISHDSIEIVQGDDGTFKLSPGTSFHAGQ